MAKSKKENLKGMDMDKLKKQLDALQESARVIRFKMEGARSKNVKELATLRKDIARIMTELNRKK